jgi:phosphatidylcholine synthase
MSTDGAAAAQTARRARAFGVHVFTASGAIVALLAMRATAAGDLDQAVLWMLAALFIDGIDGTLARRWDVGRLVPQVDGRRLDDIVDYLNYVVVPAFFLIQAELVPAWAWVALPVLASAYGFARSDAKTADHYFLGFPSYWNVVAIYA